MSSMFRVVFSKRINFKMFNLYQNLNRKNEESGDSNVIGHDRFCQDRPSRSSLRKKKRVARRTRSAADLSGPALTAANKRVAFKNSRSQSTEQSVQSANEKGPMRSESFAKSLFTRRSSSVPRHEYSALRVDCSTSDVAVKIDKQVRDGAFCICKHYLANNDRYELRSSLGNIGSRSDKHWFIVQDTSLKAERLLTLVPMPSACPIVPSSKTRGTLLSLFRSLQHPYIHPILDIEFWDAGTALVSPLNPSGSLKDMIYGTSWHDDYSQKYKGRGEGLPLRQIQCLGRQVLEALLFLKNRNFPPFYHLHAGNVIVQNGAARLAGLENPLLGIAPKPPGAADTLGFGYLLFEITAGYELTSPPSPAHLELELEAIPRVAEVLSMIFQNTRIPTLEEILCCDLFRGVELRELRGASGVQTRSPPEVLELLEIVNNPAVPSPLRRPSIIVEVENRRLEDIIEEEGEVEEAEIIRVEVHR